MTAWAPRVGNARSSSNCLLPPTGGRVKHFGNEPTYFACFRSLDGRRLKRDTNQTGMIRAVEAARLIIEKEFALSGSEQND